MFVQVIVTMLVSSLFSSKAFRPVLGRVGLKAMSMISEGDKVPSVVFKARVRDESIGGRYSRKKYSSH